MKWRIGYLIIAVLLTVFDGSVTVHYGTAIWTSRAGDILNRVLLVFFATLAATSLANIWGQAGSGLQVASENWRDKRGQIAAPIRLQARGLADV